MRPLKWLWAMLKIAFMSLGLVGCTSILTTPITGLPLFIITLAILILTPPIGHRLHAWWETLTIVLLVQTALFSFMLIVASISQADRIVMHLRNQYEYAFYLTEAQKRRHMSSGAVKEIWQGGAYAAQSLLLPGFFAGMLYLWRHDNQTAALWLQLPVLLMLVGICLILLWRKKK